MHRNAWPFFRTIKRWSLHLLLVATAGCSGNPTAAEDPGADGDGPGPSCLEAAAAERSPAQDAPETIFVAHLLVRHDGLARPLGATRNRQDACLRVLLALKSLEEGSEWDEVIEEYSDSGKTTHGSLGIISRSDVTKSFGDAAFALKIDELSYVVESDRGFHLILRTE